MEIKAWKARRMRSIGQEEHLTTDVSWWMITHLYLSVFVPESTWCFIHSRVKQTNWYLVTNRHHRFPHWGFFLFGDNPGFFRTVVTHLLAPRDQVSPVDRSQSSMAVRSSGWGQYTIPKASAVPFSWLKPWASVIWREKDDETCSDRHLMQLAFFLSGTIRNTKKKQRFPHLLGTSMLMMQVSRSSPCWSVQDTRIQRWSCDRQYPTKSTLYLGGISAHISPCSGCLGRVGPRMKGGQYSCRGLGCWMRKETWMNTGMSEYITVSSAFEPSCLHLGPSVQNWQWTLVQSLSGTWCAFAGAADVCTGSNRKRPGSAGVAGTDDSPHWLAGEATGTAPPEWDRKKSWSQGGILFNSVWCTSELSSYL